MKRVVLVLTVVVLSLVVSRQGLSSFATRADLGLDDIGGQALDLDGDPVAQATGIAIKQFLQLWHECSAEKEALTADGLVNEVVLASGDGTLWANVQSLGEGLYILSVGIPKDDYGPSFQIDFCLDKGS